MNKKLLTLQYIPYHELGNLNTEEKLKKILRSVKEDKIILIEGKLDPNEEAELITKTMEEIDKKFKGIEICSIDNIKQNQELFERIRLKIANFLLGRSNGLTIVGPATIVKEIKKDPFKIELLTLDRRKRKY